jgi:hypothetical protein
VRSLAFAGVLTGAVVLIVSVDCAAFEPIVTVSGSNEQVVCGGRFAQPSVTFAGNGPPTGDTSTWYVAFWPALTVADPGDALSPKLVTVI